MKLDLKMTLSIIFLVFLTSSVVATVEESNEKASVGNLRGKLFHLPDEEHTFDEDVPRLFNTTMTNPVQSSRNLAVAGNQDLEIYNGLWGGWKHWVGATGGGLYACGAQLRFENNQGGGDDTAANGLTLKFCGLRNWNFQQTKTIYSGNWGDWRNMAMCPYGKYIGGAVVRFEDNQGGGDDTALNGLGLWCVDKNWRGGQWKEVFGGLWGNWKSWGYRVGKLVKKARVRFEDNQGGGDDTALNGIHFNIEPPNYGVSKSEITGVWKAVGSGPQGGFTHKIIESSQTTQSKEISREETYGFTQEISAGFTIKAASFSATVSASQSFSVAHTISTSLAVYKGTETTFSCPTSGSPTSYYTMWQFTMTQRSDRNGVGFNSETRHIHCTPSYGQPPKCVIGFCADKFCQTCK